MAKRSLADLQQEYDQLESRIQQIRAYFSRRLEQGGVFHIELKVRDEQIQPLYDRQTAVYKEMEEIKRLKRLFGN